MSDVYDTKKRIQYFMDVIYPRFEKRMDVNQIQVFMDKMNEEMKKAKKR